MLQSKQVLDRYFPEVRAWLIQTAAVLDRHDRAGGGKDERLELYRRALEVLGDAKGGADRAERIQMIFSDPYKK